MADRAPQTTTGVQPPGAVDQTVRFRPGVKGLVATESRALLVRERHADGTHFWTLPGGGIHETEMPDDALERELAEELRCRCVPGDQVTSFWYAHVSLPDTVSVYSVHECALLTKPTPVSDEGITDLTWAGPDAIPPRTLPQVKLVLERALGP